MAAKKYSENSRKRQPFQSPECPKCGCSTTIKSGLIQGEQRWKCKNCAYQYTRAIPRGRPLWQKSLAVFLYTNGISMHRIANIFNVQPSTVLKWLRTHAKEQAPHARGDILIMEMNEMRRHLKSADNNSGMLCIAIGDETFRESVGITIRPR